MALTVLNNISSMTAQNALSNTQANLQKTLTQLSTGMKINSGSDDAAGLSIVSGLNANIAALTQSQQNASNGIGLLQTADGALSQVTTLLNRAVTLATEGATTGITASQSNALNTEFTAIKSEIDQIGQATNFNGSNVFSANAPPTFTSTQGSSAVPLTLSAKLTTTSNLTAGSVTTIVGSGGSFSYTAKAGDTVANLITALTTGAGATAVGAGAAASVTSGQLVVTNTAGNVSSGNTNDAQLGGGTFGVAAGVVTSTNNLAGPTLSAGSVTTIQDSGTGGTLTFKATAGESLTDLNNAIKDAVTSGTLSSGVTATIDGSGQLMISSNSSTDAIKVSSNDAALGTMNANTPSYVSSSPTALTGSSAIASGAALTVTYSDATTATFTASAATTVGNLMAAINTGTGTGISVTGTRKANTTAQLNGSGQLEVDASNGNISNVTSTSVALGTMAPTNGSSNTTTVYLGDGTTTGAANTQISTVISGLSASALNLSSDNLTSSSSATQALLDVTAAINTVSAQRGVIGASVNRLTAASSNMANQVTNLQSAANGLSNADIGKTVANMTQYNVLQSTGMAALQQSNQAQQAVLKLVQ
jgi:flagellin